MSNWSVPGQNNLYYAPHYNSKVWLSEVNLTLNRPKSTEVSVCLIGTTNDVQQLLCKAH